MYCSSLKAYQILSFHLTDVHLGASLGSDELGLATYSKHQRGISKGVEFDLPLSGVFHLKHIIVHLLLQLYRLDNHIFVETIV